MTTKRLLLAGVLSFSLLTLGGGKAEARIASGSCAAREAIFSKTGSAFPSLDLTKTANTLVATLGTDAVYNLTYGRNPDQAFECAFEAVKNNGGSALTDRIEGDGGVCPGAIHVTQDCSDFASTYNSYNVNRTRNAFKNTQSGGSVLGFANTLEGIVRTEPLPTNLAYFWNHQIRNIPFANKAFAADIDYRNAGFVKVLLVLWESFRNVAFGMLAVVMLIVGVMIMVRKKLSPQLSVTAQYALPRVAVAVILIVFSYPIGATLASSMRYFAVLMERFVCNIGASSSIVCPAPVHVIAGFFLVSALLATAATGGLAFFLAVVTALVSLAVVVLKAAIAIKAIYIMLRLMFTIVFSPIVFALGAIPGNEVHTQDYLKQWLSYVVGYVSMFVAAAVVDIVVILLVLGPFTGGLSVGTIGGSFFAIVFHPFIMIFGYIQALKMPEKAKDFIMGERNPRQKKR